MNQKTEQMPTLGQIKVGLVAHIKTFDEKKQVSAITHAAHAIEENLSDRLSTITKKTKKANEPAENVIKTKCAAEFEKVEKTAAQLSEDKENLKDAAKMNAGEEVIQIKTNNKNGAVEKMNVVLGVFGFAPMVERVEILSQKARITDNPRVCALARIEA